MSDEEHGVGIIAEELCLHANSHVEMVALELTSPAASGPSADDSVCRLQPKADVAMPIVQPRRDLLNDRRNVAWRNRCARTE
jgi:hypothetical protein